VAIQTIKSISKAVIVFAIVGCLIYVIFDRTDQVTPSDIDSSIQRAQLYLVNNYNDEYLYQDSLIKCSPNYTYRYICDPHLKKIDASINLIWIRDEVQNHTLIDYQIKNAEKFLKEQDKFMETQPLFNNQGIFVGDLQCILASMYNNTKITNDVESIVKPYGWSEKNVFDEANQYQKLSYESWCIMLMAERGSNKSKALMLSEYILNESLRLIQNPGIPIASKAYGALPPLWTFKKLEKLGYNIEPYKPKLKILQDYIAYAADDASLVKMTAAQPLFLMALSDYNYSQSTTRRIAVRLMERQDEDGGWDFSMGDITDFAKAFTTLQAIQALNKYKLTYLK
jgi:hypothetical protein